MTSNSGLNKKCKNHVEHNLQTKFLYLIKVGCQCDQIAAVQL